MRRLGLLHHKAVLDEGAVIEHAAIGIARLQHRARLRIVL
jgi:hypothetical protein